MTQQHEQTFSVADEVVLPQTATPEPAPVELSHTPEAASNGHVPVPEAVAPTAGPEVSTSNGVGPEGRHARAGRKGAHRVHELIRQGRLYEQEHGLKRGRQRLRQLIELGKQYEQEHGLAVPKKRSGRLSRAGREELLATFLRCLVRLAKPSLRADLVRLTEALRGRDDHAA